MAATKSTTAKATTKDVTLDEYNKIYLKDSMMNTNAYQNAEKETRAAMLDQSNSNYWTTGDDGVMHYNTRGDGTFNQDKWDTTLSGVNYNIVQPQAALTQADVDAAVSAAVANAMANYQSNIDQQYQNIIAQQRAQYEAEQAAKQRQIDQTVASIKSNENTINSEYEKAQREAYINNMLQKNQLGDYLEALGYTGGLAETTAGQIANNYETNRQNATSQRDAALRNNEDLIAQAKVSGDTALADMASNYMDNYINTLQNQIQMNYQAAQDQQAQANADREYQLALAKQAMAEKQYQDSINAGTEEEKKNLAAQDFSTFLNTYQGKYTKKATYEKWIQNLQAMDDPYGYNAQKIAYLKQYITQNFNGSSGTAPSGTVRERGQNVEDDTINNAIVQEEAKSTNAQDKNFNDIKAQITLTLAGNKGGYFLNGMLSQLVSQIKEMQAQRGLTEAQAQYLLNMMK